MEANEVLVALLARALDREDRQMAGAVYERLHPSLPWPNWFDKGYEVSSKADRERVARLWKPDFAPVVIRFARWLTSEATPRDGDKEAVRGPASARGTIAYIYACLGRQEDLADCLKAYALSIEPADHHWCSPMAG